MQEIEEKEWIEFCLHKLLAARFLFLPSSSPWVLISVVAEPECTKGMQLANIESKYCASLMKSRH